MSTLKKIVLIVISISLVSLTTPPTNGYCADWVYVGSSRNYIDYYNSESVKINKQNNVIKVWVKRVFTEKGRNDWLKDYDAIKKQKYADINYILALYLINYKEWRYAISHITQYSKSGNVLFDGEMSAYKWSDIVPDSIDEFLINRIAQDCNIQK